MSAALNSFQNFPPPERIVLLATPAARVAGVAVCTVARWRDRLRAERSPTGAWLYPLDELRVFFGVPEGTESAEGLDVLRCPGCVRAVDARWSRAFHTCRRLRAVDNVPSRELSEARGALLSVLLRKVESPAPGSEK